MEEKLKYENLSEDIPGPYYDPHACHLHIWKAPHKIQNFKGEQKSNCKYIIELNEVKPGEYCSICHERRTGIVPNYKTKVYNTDNTYNINYRWFKILVKLLNKDELNNLPREVSFNKKEDTNILVLYNINSYTTIIKKLNNLTYYQKFRFKEPNYKNKYIFIINNNIFSENYYNIS